MALRFVIDTREPERTAYSFDGYEAIRAKLDAGDYSIEGLEKLCVVERKTKADAYGCVGRGRKRFEAALERLAQVDRPCIVIESSLYDFSTPPSRTRITSGQAVNSYIGWAAKFRIPVWFADNAWWAAKLTMRWLLGYGKREGLLA